jgi:NAD(P)-dependent dehydrogenase (short-subunit alcohol dehydrogenase family)
MTTQKTVLITGASRGIGAAMVRAFKEAGFKVAACARNVSKMESADLKMSCDVSKVEQVRAVIEKVRADFGHLDVLINNAGTAKDSPMEGNDDSLWHEVMDVNLNGTYYFSKYALPLFGERGGRIINLGSVLSHKGVPDGIAYCAAKHAVLGFTRALALKVAARKITVNAICPGWTRTDMAKDRMNEIGITEEQAGKGLPVGRITEPHEVASLALYLASDAAATITGQSMVIDGGFLA